MNRFLASVAFIAFTATAADAASFSWTVANPDFYNIVGAGSNRTETKTDNDVTLRWGIGSARNPGQNSGYKFDGQNGSLSINPGETKNFVFGDFTHFNWDINGTSGSGVALDKVDLTFNFDLNGNLFTPTFTIDHNETLNNYANFPACCNDTVQSTTYDIGSFIDGNLKYAVFLSAIGMNNREQTNSSMAWLGTVSVSEVPIPPAALLFGTALAGVASLGRKRRKKV
jgi:hypothetical protein